MELSYQQQLKHPEWLELRDYLIERRGFACEDCGIKGALKDFNLHHKYYNSKTMAWMYPHDCYKVLCWECHEGTTEAIKSLLYTFGNFDSGRIVEVANAIQFAISDGNEPGLVAGWVVASLAHYPRVHLVVEEEVERAG